MAHATGEFEVKITPMTTDGDPATSKLGRMSLEKQFHGSLEGVSKGEMLTAMTDVNGSAGYVAIECVNGTLQGRNGSFVLQHSGTMANGAHQLSISVVPDSGTGELAGIVGQLSIQITAGKHYYEFEYTLPEPL